jgi:hypothetical protein
MRAGGDALRDLVPAFAAFHERMMLHLRAEDDVGLALLRHHFTHKEFQPVLKQLVQRAPPTEVAWLLRPMGGGDDARRDWMTRVALIPALTQELVMLPAARRYRRNVVWPMKALCAGATEAPSPPQSRRRTTRRKAGRAL